MAKIFWEFTGETRVEFGVELKQIRATCDFGAVVKGDLGGWIGGAVHLAQNGLAWVGRNVKAFGGDFWGGTFRGGTFWGGTFRGGDFWGGDFRGGDFWGGTFRGGTFWGGTFRGGDFRGGDFWGGTFEGGDFLTISPIGSEDGQFTAAVTESGEIICNRGCFSGTLAEFEKAVEETHGGTDPAREYALVVQLVRSRLDPVAAKRKAAKETA